MIFSIIPVPVYLIPIVLYMVARNRIDLKRTLIIQPTATFLALVFVTLSFLSPEVDKGYSIYGSWLGWDSVSWWISSTL